MLGQYGTPSLSGKVFVGMMLGLLTGIVDAVEAFYGSARASQVETPPLHALNRGNQMTFS